MTEYKLFWQNYVNFSGKSTRKEFWMAYLFNILASIAIGIITAILPPTFTLLLSSAFSLAIFIPSIAIAIRRLHDIGKSGWNLLFFLVPLVGWIIVLIFLIKPSVATAN